MKIASLRLENPLILAPMAGITDLAFRLIVKSLGCGLVCSEMVSANGLVRAQKKTRDMLASTPEEKPLSVQIFGADPDVMAEAGRIVEELGADVLDINFGCSVKKVVKNGYGVALMKDLGRAEALLKAVRRAVTLPFTIKMRSGHDPSGTQALELARMAEACGVNAVCVHPRTASQGFSGRADWSLIQRVKRALTIPVIGNGDVATPEDVLRMREHTGCDFVMIGRAAQGNPWLFSQTLSLMSGAAPEETTPDMRRAMMMEFARLSVKFLGEKRACLKMRGRLPWFCKGLPNARSFRESIQGLSSEQEALDKIRAVFDSLEKREQG